MSAITLGLISLAAMIGGAFCGQWLGRLLPDHHRDPSTREAVALATSLIVTVTSLTLSLLLYSTKAAFDTAQSDTGAFAASIIVLDRSLTAYGPDAQLARALLRSYTESALHTTWPEEFGGERDVEPIESRTLGRQLGRLHDLIRALRPATPSGEQLAAECRSNMNTLVNRRFAVIESARRSIPLTLLAGVVAWLTVIFVGLGLNAPRNGVVAVTLGICALVAASCITLMDEMDGAFTGLIKVSSAPMSAALADLSTDASADGATATDAMMPSTPSSGGGGGQRRVWPE